MTSFAAGAKALRDAAQQMQASTTVSVTEATALLTAAVRAGRGAAGAGSGRLRGVGRNGAPIGEMGTVRGHSGLVRATGPAWLLDHPTKPHTITALSGSVLATPYGPRTVVHHPGTPGKPYFEEAVDSVGPLLPNIFERNVVGALVKAVV